MKIKKKIKRVQIDDHKLESIVIKYIGDDVIIEELYRRGYEVKINIKIDEI